MRIIRSLLVATLLVGAALGQAFYTDRALGVNPFNRQTNSPVFISYGQVRVCTSADINTPFVSPCPDLAAITDIHGGALTVQGGNFGQLTTDVVGRFSFGCPIGTFLIQIAATGSNTPQAAYPITCPITAGATGTGNVNSSGVPTSGQTAQWISATQIAGVNNSGTGFYILQTGPTIINPTITGQTSTNGTFNSPTLNNPIINGLILAPGTTLQQPLLISPDFQGVGAGNFVFGQGLPLMPQPNSAQVIAPQSIVVQGYNYVLPGTPANGMLSTLNSTGGTGHVTCTSCGGLSTANIVIDTAGAYATIPACQVSLPPITFPPNTPATCKVQTLSNGSSGTLSGGSASVIITQPGTGYTSQATLSFSNDVDIFIGAPFAVDLLAQHAAIGNTAIPNPQGGAHTISIGQQGQYRLSYDTKITTAAGTSSTLGPITVKYTDPDGVLVTLTTQGILNSGVGSAVGATSNDTQTVLLGLPMLLNCAANTDISYSVAYASNPAGAMAYNLHIRVEPL